MQTDRDTRRIVLGAGRCAVLTVMAFSVQQAWATQENKSLPGLSIADAAAVLQSADTPRLRSGLPVVLAQPAFAKPKLSTAGAQTKAVTATTYFVEHFEDCEAADPFPAPEPYPTPAQFVVYNVDGLTPATQVAYVSDAWIVREDFIAADGSCAMFSTSWYSPAGAANDWATFPAAGPITPTAATKLSWRALAPDASYPDGYEVRYSTATNAPADFMANSPLLTVGAENNTWTEHNVDLSAHAGTPIYLAFRNNSNDKFLLLIDDVVVSDADSYDPVLDAIGAVPAIEYSAIPGFLGASANVEAVVSNAGFADISNVVVDGDILVNGGSVSSFSSTPIATLAAGANQSVAAASLTLNQLGDWSVEATVSADEGDDNPGNSSLATALTTVTSDEMSRFQGPVTGSLGIGEGTAGELGHQFDLPSPATLTAARLALENGDTVPGGGDGIGDLNGQDIVVNLREWDAGNSKPGAVIVSGQVSVPVDAPIGPLPLEIDLPDTSLPAGRFVLSVVEPEAINMRLYTSPQKFTPGAGWVDFPTSPFGDWANVENFGFSVSFYLSAVLTLPNAVPIAQDDAFSIDEDGSLMDSVAGNDTPSTDGGNTWLEVVAPTNGALSLSTNGDFTYTPNSNFNGADSFTYQLCDINSDCDDATVTITVNSVNDVPMAENDQFQVTQDGSIDGDVSLNDTLSGDGGNTWGATSTTFGQLIFNPGGTFTYTPDPGFNGLDSFTYQICDTDTDCDAATVTLEVLPLDIFADGMEGP